MKQIAIVVLLCIYMPGWAQNGILPEILASEEVAAENFLPDLSYAGYRYGESSFKQSSLITIPVTEYGAVPDDGLDDSDAIIAAIEEAEPEAGTCVILFPPGRFEISKIIYIDKSNIILRGSGSGSSGTKLHFARPLMYLSDPPELTELREYLVTLNKRQKEPEHGIDLPFSQYSWSGGFIWVKSPGSRAKAYLEKYDKPVRQLARAIGGQRGKHQVTVSDPGSFEAGKVYKLHWFNKDGKEGSFLEHLYDGADVEIGSHHWNYPERPLVSQVVEVTDIINDTVSIKVPLLHDVKTEWHCVLSPWDHLEEVGIENLSFEFPETPYTAHHVEQGYNAIYLTGLMHGWVKNVSIKNANSGILSEDISNVTIEDIRTNGTNLAHYSVSMGGVQNVLVKSMVVKNRVVHPLSFNTLSIRCVYTDCLVEKDPVLDQHSGANHQNLFDDITVVTDHPVHKTHHYPLFKSGGASYWYPAHGAFSTFWNIHIHFHNGPVDGQPVLLDGVDDGPSARLVGIHSNVPIQVDYEPDAYLERINQQPRVPSLYQYQLEQRISDMPFDDYYVLDRRLLERSRKAIQKGHKAYLPAYEQLLKDAEEAMLGGLPSVMDKEFVPPSGDKHDYMSIAPYYWPNPDTPDGLPYILKDGLTNPERDKYDRIPVEKMVNRTRTLSLAYYFSNEEKFADMAVQLLTTWFLDPETKMNPHLRYGQVKKGRNDGSDIGIIDCGRLSDLPDAMRLFRESEAYSASFEAGMKSWFSKYLDWLWNHPFGQGERNNQNNHGTAYDVQTTILALFAGRMDLARNILSEVPVRRIDVQIKPDGRQPLELRRTKSYHYTVGNLMHLINLSLMADQLNLDLINYTGPDGQSILNALDYVIQYSVNTDQWPYEQITSFESENRSFYEVLLKTYLLTNDEKYLEAADALPLEDKMKLRANLKFPLVPDMVIEGYK